MPTLFLSHAGPDKAAAIELKRRLLASPDAKETELKVWLDVDDLDEGVSWQAQIEAAINAATSFAVVVGSHGIRNWVRAEIDLALSRAIKDDGFRIIPILQDGGTENLTPFVKRYHALRDPLNDPDSMQRLLRAALGRDKDGQLVLTDDPFPGLRSMTEDWADRFFGRRAETNEVLDLLRHHRAVVIVADSGAGKSSLAMAGVGHAWRGGALREDRSRADDPTIWHIVTMRPAENPIERLRDAIETAATQLGRENAAVASFRERLATDPAFSLRCGLDPTNTNTLLIIDQAEELVTITPRERRPEFGRLITALSDAMGDRLRILVTLRSDHVNLVTGVEGLGPMIRSSDAQFSLKQPVELGEIVRGPLGLTEHRNEAEQNTLIGLLCKDLSDRPGHLALAQMTLSLVWRDRGKHGGLLGAYAANGGARAALGNEAARIEGQLSIDDNARLMSIFVRLIQLSEVDIGATRRIAARDEFDDEENRLIDRLSAEEFGRLVQTGPAHVEIAHEALITQWPRLHEYLIDHAADLRNLTDLIRRAKTWLADGESARHLTSLADEERFQALRLTHAAWLAPVERRFLDWSRGEHQRIGDERERTGRHIRNGVAALVLLLLALLGVSWFAYDRHQSAKELLVLSAKSRADALVLLAMAQSETAPVRALKLALGAWPNDESGPFPTSAVTFRAISKALAYTRPHHLMRGHESGVRSVAFSPDGRRIVSGGDDGTLRLWDPGTGEAVGEPLRGHNGRVSSVAFSPDGHRIVSGGYDGMLRLWDASTGEALGEPLREHDGGVSSVAFSPDGHRIVSGSQDGTLRLWDVSPGAVLGEPLRGHDGGVSSIAFSPDGSRIVSGGEDGTLRLWDSSTGAPLGEPLRGHEGWVLSVALSPDGSRIVSGGYDGMLRLWDASTGEALGEPLRGHEGGVNSVAFSPDGRSIVSGSEDGALRRWDASTGAALGEPLRGHEGGISSIAYSPDGRRVVSGGDDGTLRLWDVSMGATLGEPLRGHEGGVNSVAFSPDGNRIVSGGDDGTLRLWDASIGKPLGERLRGHKGAVRSVAISPNGSRIVSGGRDGTLRLWDASTGAALGEPLSGHEGWVFSVAFSPDGHRIVSSGMDGTLRLWDASTGAAVGEPLKGNEESLVPSVAFSSNGRHIVSGNSDGTLRLWDASTGEPLGEPLRGHESEVVSIALSPDGRQIVSGDGDGTLRLWDATKGAAMGEPLRGHEGWVISVAFSPDGHRIVSGGDDGTLRLWDTSTGAALGEPLRWHEGRVISVAFSPDGHRIVSGGMDGTLRLWGNMPPGNILQVACRSLPHINGLPDQSTEGLAAEIGINGLLVPEDCGSYNPPLPPEFRQ